MLVPTFQHPCIDKEDDATSPLLSFQVHGMGCLQKKPHRSSPPPPTATGRVIHGQTLVMPHSHLCPLCLGAALGWGTVPALLLKAFPAIFGQQLPFQIFASVLVPGLAHSWGSLSAPCCAKLNSPSCSIPHTSISRIPMGHFSHSCPHSRSGIHRESPQPSKAPTPQGEPLTAGNFKTSNPAGA